MEEIEVKVLGIDTGEVIPQLVSMGAKKLFEGVIHSAYYDTSGNHDATRPIVRVRKKGGQCHVTLKLRKDDPDARVSDEYEIEVDDYEGARKLFRNLGYREFATDTRRRTSYRVWNSSIEIDEHEGIPAFLEIESPDKDELKTLVEALGFSYGQALSWTTKDVLNHYQKYPSKKK